jgi:hypothetical protein
MTPILQPQLLVAGLAGLSGGAMLFARGLAAYRRGSVLASIATSRIDALAVGEVRITGTVEPLAETLISPLQSAQCVWYRSSIVDSGRDHQSTVFEEERSAEFQVRDTTGTVRVIPRGGRWELAAAFDESSGVFGDEPIGLRRRVGPASAAVSDFDRDAAIADLLTVHTAAPDAGDASGGPSLGPLLGNAGGQRHYREARLEPGQTVTIIGYVRPFAEVAGDDEPEAGSDDDPAIGADLQEAREAGLLAHNPEEAWGNAAISGFGIGRPVRQPHLDPGADDLPPADDRQAQRAERIFTIAPDTLVLSSDPGTPLVVYAGEPAEARAYDRGAFYRGLAGAGLLTISAAGLAVMLNGSL